MQYLCLIYHAEDVGPQPGGPDFPAFMQAYQTFTQEVVEKDMLVSGNALQPVATATTVSRETGKVEITDGPFAETKEQLGGYYLLECKDLYEALVYAAKIPSAEHGRIEVRPVVVWDD